MSGPHGGPPRGPPGGPRGPMRAVEKARNPRAALMRLARYLLPFKFRIAIIIVLVIASTLLSLLLPYLIGMTIDRFIVGKDVTGLFRMVLIVLGVGIASYLASAGQGLMMASISQRALRSLRKDLFDHIQTLSLSYFDKRPAGELMSRFTNDVDAISQALTLNAIQLVTSLLSLAGIVVMMFLLNIWLALGSLLVLPIMIVVVLLIGKNTLRGFRDLQTQLGSLNGMIEETIGGERVIQAFGQQGVVLGNFDKINGATRDAGITAFTYSMMIMPAMNVLGNIGVIVVAGLGGWLAIAGLATVGNIAAFITYARNFTGPLRQLANLYNSIQTALAGAERIFDVIDEKPEITDIAGAVPLMEIKGDVTFDHVDFSYVDGVPVLRDVSFHAEPGQIVAFVGPTGAGKTTMVNVLSRFYDIQGGTILVDGMDIKAVKKDSLRRQLGTVLQDNFLFSDTVLENIRYGNLQATDEQCVEAAKLANADQFITRLPQGYKTLLTERGSNLSQGQRQLLAIARAVIANPRILILDEATSSVDTRTEMRIQRALLRLMEGRTSFVIAHRLSTIRKADQVLVIRDGSIVERGTHGSLMAMRGFYYGLYMSQFKGTSNMEKLGDAKAGRSDARPKGIVRKRLRASGGSSAKSK